MKLISWNIDSLNAALSGASVRAALSREVLNSIVENDPEVIALQEAKLPSDGPAEKQLEILEHNLKPDIYLDEFRQKMSNIIGIISS